MRFNLLYNFISPVTGRVLADTDYVLVGDDIGVAVPSPILIDIQLDLLGLRQNVNNLLDASFVLNFPNVKIPNAQVLSTLPDGFMSNVGGIISTSEVVPIDGLFDIPEHYLITGNNLNRPITVAKIILSNMADLTNGRIWRGNGLNRPVESDALTAAENNVSNLLTDLGNLASVVSAISDTVDAVSSSVDAIETGLGLAGGVFGFVGVIATLAGMAGAIATNASDIDDLQDSVGAILVDITGIHTTLDTHGGLIEGLFDIADAITGRIDTLAVTLDGDVTGSGPIATPIFTELQLTLDEIKVAENTVNLNDQKIVNLKTDEVEEQDALNFKFFWEFIHNRVEVLWPT